MSNKSEVQLEFDQSASIWQGGDDTIFVRMPDSTFRAYVSKYLATRGMLHPTPRQRYSALTHCRHLSYWLNCIDPSVRIIRRH